MGPFVIALCVILVISLALPAVAHAAAAQTGGEEQILQIAIEICAEAIDLMSGVEQIEPETLSNFQSITTVDGEVINVVSDVAFKQSESIANQHVRAIEVLLDALHERVRAGGEAMTINDFMETAQGLDRETKEIISLAMENAEAMQQSDPLMAKQYADLGASVENVSGGSLVSTLEDIIHQGEVTSRLSRGGAVGTTTTVPTHVLPEQKT